LKEKMKEDFKNSHLSFILFALSLRSFSTLANNPSDISQPLESLSGLDLPRLQLHLAGGEKNLAVYVFLLFAVAFVYAGCL